MLPKEDNPRINSQVPLREHPATKPPPLHPRDRLGALLGPLRRLITARSNRMPSFRGVRPSARDSAFELGIQASYWYYRTMIERLLELLVGAKLTVPLEVPDLYAPPDHRRQLFVANDDSWLYIVVVQRWNAWFDFTLLDIAELINCCVRPRVMDGRLTVETRGYFEGVVNGMPRA